MAKLPGYRRIFKTDYQQEYQQLVDTLSTSVNNGFETLYDALNKKLSIKDNFVNGPKDITVTVDATGTPKQTTSFILDSGNKLLGLQVILVTPTPVNMPYVAFSQDNKAVLVSKITGLTANIKYTIRIVPHAE